MDPDANWAEQKRLKAKAHPDKYDRARLRELQAALREWLAGGGYAPQGYPVRGRRPGGQSRRTHRSKTVVRVHGYRRSDGTKVKGHTRHA